MPNERERAATTNVKKYRIVHGQPPIAATLEDDAPLEDEDEDVDDDVGALLLMS